MVDNKEKNTIIKTVDENGKRLELVILTPGHKVLQDAQMVYNVELTSMIKQSVSGGDKLLSRQQLEQHLGELGIWTEKDAKQFLRLQLELRESELKLKQGGIKISEAKTIALGMKSKRALLLILYGRRSQFDAITMESIADNRKFKFLITKCVVMSKDNMPFFINIEDYELRQNETSAVDAATILAGQIYGYDKQMESNLTENKWLQQFNFADKQGRLIDENNRLIDTNGNLVNGDGRFVDKEGSLVDNQGRPVDENGDFVVNETKPFTDDSGKPLKIDTKKRKGKKQKQK